MASWSALFDNVHGAPYALLVDRHPALYRLNKLLRKSRTGLRSSRAMLAAAVDAVTSGVAVSAETYKRVAADVDPGQVNNGGARTIETRTTRASGNITAAEEAELTLVITDDGIPTTYPTELAGNGGPRDPGVI